MNMLPTAPMYQTKIPDLEGKNVNVAFTFLEANLRLLLLQPGVWQNLEVVPYVSKNLVVSSMMGGRNARESLLFGLSIPHPTLVRFVRLFYESLICHWTQCEFHCTSLLFKPVTDRVLVQLIGDTLIYFIYFVWQCVNYFVPFQILNLGDVIKIADGTMYQITGRYKFGPRSPATEPWKYSVCKLVPMATVGDQHWGDSSSMQRFRFCFVSIDVCRVRISLCICRS
jgi:hypothetical protein